MPTIAENAKKEGIKIPTELENAKPILEVYIELGESKNESIVLTTKYITNPTVASMVFSILLKFMKEHFGNDELPEDVNQLFDDDMTVH